MQAHIIPATPVFRNYRAYHFDRLGRFLYDVIPANPILLYGLRGRLVQWEAILFADLAKNLNRRPPRIGR